MIYGRKSLISKGYGKFAAKAGSQIAEYFSNYFETSQALPPTIKFLAVPDFNSDTSKNWGLSIFHEEFLLMPEFEYSIKDKVTIGKKISNELAHFVSNR